MITLDSLSLCAYFYCAAAHRRLFDCDFHSRNTTNERGASQITPNYYFVNYSRFEYSTIEMEMQFDFRKPKNFFPLKLFFKGIKWKQSQLIWIIWQNKIFSRVYVIRMRNGFSTVFMRVWICRQHECIYTNVYTRDWLKKKENQMKISTNR